MASPSVDAIDSCVYWACALSPSNATTNAIGWAGDRRTRTASASNAPAVEQPACDPPCSTPPSALLSEVGYDELSVEAVASRAGVHKTTVYRRWPTKPELIADAALVQAAAAVPIPDTGNLLDDLQTLAREVVANIASDGGARRARTLVAAACSGELADVLHSFWAHRLDASAAIIERAVDRGELPATINPTLIIEAVIGPIWLRLLLTVEPLDEEFADAIAELVTIAARRT